MRCVAVFEQAHAIAHLECVINIRVHVLRIKYHHRRMPVFGSAFVHLSPYHWKWLRMRQLIVGFRMHQALSFHF